MSIMKPIATTTLPENGDWLYEVKYDGFRATLLWEKNKIQLLSRNKLDLSANFPEIITFCQKIQPKIADNLPLKLDGELVVLNHTHQANFTEIQRRNMLQSAERIKKLAAERPATFLIFDMMVQKGVSIENQTLVDRKGILNTTLKHHLTKRDRLQIIGTYHQYEKISQVIFQAKGEGIVAKRKRSKYQAGKNHRDWLKLKNWRTIHAFLTAYDPRNGYFEVGVFAGEKVHSIGKCKHGLDDETTAIIREMFVKNGERVDHTYRLPPAICASIDTLDLHGGEIREPQFAAILPKEDPSNCTVDRLYEDLAMFPDVDLSNLDKTFWQQQTITKGNFLVYIREISAYMLPYLQNRALTIIRCPDGVEATCFYQKNIPSYARDFVNFFEEDDKRSIVCNDLASLIWLANHSAIEYHVPFQTVSSSFPNEIVFDLDPPNREKIRLAVVAAQMIKSMLDELALTSFVKTSGNKGLQIHVPLPHNKVSYEETAILTEAIARTLEQAKPDLFTTERMKKNREGKLYIDYVQHGENKTIIAPYSPRKTEDATIATPLFWHEVNDSLRPDEFTIQYVVKRVKTLGCPWLFYDEVRRGQDLSKMMTLIGT